MPLNASEAKTHVCSRHLTLSRLTFHCYSSSDSAVNFRALLGALLRKSLKTQQQSIHTFQQYLRERTPYVTDWSLFSMRPCLRILKRCSQCSSMNQATDLQEDFKTLEIIFEVIGSIIKEDADLSTPVSEIGKSLRSLQRFTKQLLCEIHTFLLLSGTHSIGNGFINDVVKSQDWCVFSSISSRYERDIYLLRQIANISSKIHKRSLDTAE
ncbi:uncharacterized protein LOC133186971 [Saccostrea echinata]|uniref:uncharacterized protein LOC133186971 n=1 Tax=Saccostrea echinata TaxID=191078 RepID=UPI002A836B38|nr:uncharacterized protein LOC133186971 [Saccostrea echinata]